MTTIDKGDYFGEYDYKRYSKIKWGINKNGI